MAAITVQSVPRNSQLTDAAFTAASGGADTFENDGNTIVVVRNDDAGTPRDATVTSVACSHGRTGDVATGGIDAVGGIAIMGPFPTTLFGNTVTITGDTTDVKFAVVSLARPV